VFVCLGLCVCVCVCVCVDVYVRLCVRRCALVADTEEQQCMLEEVTLP
jgi:hypothetical protein